MRRGFWWKLRRPATLAFTAGLIALLVGAGLLRVTVQLNPVASAAVFLIYTACVWLVRPSQLAGFYRMALWLLFFSALLNVAYELTQSVFFIHFTDGTRGYAALVTTLWGATVGDAVTALALFFAVTVFRGGRWQWPWGWRAVVLAMALAFVVQAAIEIGTLRAGLWPYAASMPRLPLLHVGLWPVLQAPLLLPLTLWLAHRVSGGREL